WQGDPTEIALIEYAETKARNKEHLKELSKKYKREAELPFDSDRKSMTTVHKFGTKHIAIVKGAAETISSLLESDNELENIREQNINLASKGIRVLAYGYRILDEIPEPFIYEEVEKDLVFAGLVGMIRSEEHTSELQSRENLVCRLLL